MKAHTALCYVALLLSCIGIILAALEPAWAWCTAYGVLAIVSLLALRRSLRIASEEAPGEDRREDDPKERIEA